MSTLLLDPAIAAVDRHDEWDPRSWDWRRRLGALIALWLVTGIYIVPADQQALVTRYGRVVEPRVLPGIHDALPSPIDSVARLKVQQLQRLIIGGDPSDLVLGRLEPSTSQFLTGDQNLIHLRVAVQFSVAVPREYLFTAEEVKRAVAAAVESELVRRVGQRGVDAVLTTEKTAIQDEVRAAAQQLTNQYRLGVQLASINIESAQPPPEAREAFNDVASARADSARIVNEALGFAGDIVPKARGEASQSLQAAEAYRLRKINESKGDASRFIQVSAEYERAASVNGRRLYLETMEQVLPKIKKLLVDSRGNLDLTIVRKQESSPKP